MTVEAEREKRSGLATVYDTQFAPHLCSLGERVIAWPCPECLPQMFVYLKVWGPTAHGGCWTTASPEPKAASVWPPARLVFSRPLSLTASLRAASVSAAW